MASKAQNKFDKIMSEWESGKLRDSHGTLVKHPSEHKRSLAIALSSARSIDPNFKKKEDGGEIEKRVYEFLSEYPVIQNVDYKALSEEVAQALKIDEPAAYDLTLKYYGKKENGGLAEGEKLATKIMNEFEKQVEKAGKTLQDITVEDFNEFLERSYKNIDSGMKKLLRQNVELSSQFKEGGSVSKEDLEKRIAGAKYHLIDSIDASQSAHDKIDAAEVDLKEAKRKAEWAVDELDGKPLPFQQGGIIEADPELLKLTNQFVKDYGKVPKTFSFDGKDNRYLIEIIIGNLAKTNELDFLRNREPDLLKLIKEKYINIINDYVIKLRAVGTKRKGESKDEILNAADNIENFFKSNMADGGTAPEYMRTVIHGENKTLSEFEQELKSAFKNTNWFFFNGTVDGKPVRMKLYPGVKEVDVQIFTIDGKHASIGSYAGKKDTLKNIMNALGKTELEAGGEVAEQTGYDEDISVMFELIVDTEKDTALDNMYELTKREASKENFDKFAKEAQNISNIELKDNILEVIKNVRDGKYRNEFKNTYGGKAGDVRKVSQASSIFYQFQQAFEETGTFKDGGTVSKIRQTPNYYRFRIKTPVGASKCRVPDWGKTVAESVKAGSKIVTCKKADDWFVQAIMVKKSPSVDSKKARQVAREILSKVNRKKKTSKKEDGGLSDAEYLHIYKLTDTNGNVRIETMEDKYMPAGIAMKKMYISLNGLKAYKYNGASATSDEYKEFKKLIDSGKTKLEAYNEVFAKDLADGGSIAEDKKHAESMTKDTNFVKDYKGYKIYEDKDGKSHLIVYPDYRIYIVGLDDSKTSGRRTSVATTVKDAENYIDWITKKEAGGNVLDRGERPSPRESATLFNEGFEMTGQDGNLWKIAIASNGVHRWQKVRFEDGGEISAEITNLVDKLMEIESHIWDKLKIRSGSQLYEDSSLQAGYSAALYKELVKQKVTIKEIKENKDVIFDELQDQNYHVLNNAFGLLGYYGAAEVKKDVNRWKNYPDSSLDPKAFGRNPSLYEQGGEIEEEISAANIEEREKWNRMSKEERIDYLTKEFALPLEYATRIYSDEIENLPEEIKAFFKNGGKTDKKWLDEYWRAYHNKFLKPSDRVRLPLDDKFDKYDYGTIEKVYGNESRVKWDNGQITDRTVNKHLEKEVDAMEAGGKISVSKMKDKIKKFISKFPKDATSWADATDELPDLHNHMAEIYNGEEPKVKYKFDFLYGSKTPSERNTRYREGIEKLLGLMSDNQIHEVYNHYDNWFENRLQHGGDTELIKNLKERGPEYQIYLEEAQKQQKMELQEQDWKNIWYIEGAKTGAISNISTSLEDAQKALSKHNQHMVDKLGLGSMHKARVLKKDWDGEKINISNLKSYLRKLAATGPIFEQGGTVDPEKDRLEKRIAGLKLGIEAESTSPEQREQFQKALAKLKQQLQDYKPVQIKEVIVEKIVSTGGTKVEVDVDSQAELDKAEKIKISVKAEGEAPSKEKEAAPAGGPEVPKVSSPVTTASKAEKLTGKVYLDIQEKYSGAMRNELYQKKKGNLIKNYTIKIVGKINRVFLENDDDLNLMLKIYNDKREKKGDSKVDKKDVAGQQMKRGGKTKKFVPVKKRVEPKSVKKNLSNRGLKEIESDIKDIEEAITEAESENDDKRQASLHRELTKLETEHRKVSGVKKSGGSIKKKL